MIVLGLDTGSTAPGAALWCTGTQQCLGAVTFPAQRGQAAELVPVLQRMLSDAGKTFAAIDRFGVAVGPGSFTGLRVGLAAMRGFALAADRPLAGISSFAAAWACAAADYQPRQAEARGGAKPGLRVLVCIESRRDDLFVQPFDAEGNPLDQPQDLTPQAFAAFVKTLPDTSIMFSGDAAQRAADLLDDRRQIKVKVPSATGVATAVARLTGNMPAGKIADHPAVPTYLREPDVSVSLTVR